jgi:hypothetical protein
MNRHNNWYWWQQQPSILNIGQNALSNKRVVWEDLLQRTKRSRTVVISVGQEMMRRFFGVNPFIHALATLCWTLSSFYWSPNTDSFNEKKHYGISICIFAISILSVTDVGSWLDFIWVDTMTGTWSFIDMMNLLHADCSSNNGTEKERI